MDQLFFGNLIKQLFILKELRNYFCVCHKNRRKRNQHFKLISFKINLHFGISNKISAHGKLNLRPVNSIFFGLFPRNVRKTDTDYQSILQPFLFCLKRSVSQIFKSSSCKKIFPKCVYHWYSLLRWILFIPCDNWKQYFFTQIHHYPEAWCNRHVAAFFKTSVLKEVRILCPLSLQQYYNDAYHQRLKIELLLLKFSPKKLLAESVSFTLSHFVNVPHFSL